MPSTHNGPLLPCSDLLSFWRMWISVCVCVRGCLTGVGVLFLACLHLHVICMGDPMFLHVSACGRVCGSPCGCVCVLGHSTCPQLGSMASPFHIPTLGPGPQDSCPCWGS